MENNVQLHKKPVSQAPFLMLLLFLGAAFTGCNSGGGSDENPETDDPKQSGSPDVFVAGDNVVLNPDYKNKVLTGIEAADKILEGIDTFYINDINDGSVKYTDLSKIPDYIGVKGTAEIDIGANTLNIVRASASQGIRIKAGNIPKGKFSSGKDIIIEGTTNPDSFNPEILSGFVNSDIRAETFSNLYVTHAGEGVYLASNTAEFERVKDSIIEAPNVKATDVINSEIVAWNVDVKNFSGVILTKKGNGDILPKENADAFKIKISGVVQGGSHIGNLMAFGSMGIYIDLSEMVSVEYNEEGVTSHWAGDPDKLTIEHIVGKVFIDKKHLANVHVNSSGATIVTNDSNFDLDTAKNTHGWKIYKVINVTDLGAAVKAHNESLSAP